MLSPGAPGVHTAFTWSLEWGEPGPSATYCNILPRLRPNALGWRGLLRCARRLVAAMCAGV
eukprot:scaffold18728_cov121-Isochrysis_galbana.AAC.8